MLMRRSGLHSAAGAGCSAAAGVSPLSPLSSLLPPSHCTGSTGLRLTTLGWVGWCLHTSHLVPVSTVHYCPLLSTLSTGTGVHRHNLSPNTDSGQQQGSPPQQSVTAGCGLCMYPAPAPSPLLPPSLYILTLHRTTLTLLLATAVSGGFRWEMGNGSCTIILSIINIYSSSIDVS